MEYGTCTVIAELAGGAKHTLRCNSARVEKDPETGRVTAFLREQPQTDAAIHINTPAIASIQVFEVDEAWAEEDDELDELDNTG
jgi:hypothetical protein